LQHSDRRRLVGKALDQRRFSLSPRSGRGFRISTWLAVAVMGLAVAGSAWATRVERRSLTELRDQAASIVLGHVVDISTRDGAKRMVWTDYTVRVEEVLVGEPMIGSELTLSFAGGTTATHSIEVVGVPRLEAGERYVFFLRGDEAPYLTPTVGFDQGIYHQLDVDFGGKPTRILISPRGFPLELADGGRIFRGDRATLNSRGEGPPALVEAPPPLPEDEREEAPDAFDAAGVLVPPPPSEGPQAQAAKPRARRFASLSELAAFARRRIQEVPREDR